jgi:PPOX class probable F420-dependent enzyme
MPTGPLPPEIAAFLAAPRPAVVATTRADGSPLTAATWYVMEDGHVLITMGPGGARARNLRRDGRFCLTVLAENWYSQVTIECRAAEFREDRDHADLQRIAAHYGDVYEPEGAAMTVVGAIERWHVFGSPAGT